MRKRILIISFISIFLSLAGYFYFPSLIKKESNQTISNNNNKKDNENSKDISDINNKKENKKGTSWLINVILLIIIVAVIIIIIKIVINCENKFDFRKENFCPNFFLIRTSKILNELENKFENKKNIKFKRCIKNDFKENADSFFKILAKFILFNEVYDSQLN